MPCHTSAAGLVFRRTPPMGRAVLAGQRSLLLLPLFIDLDLLLRIISWTFDLRNISRTETNSNNSLKNASEFH